MYSHEAVSTRMAEKIMRSGRRRFSGANSVCSNDMKINCHKQKQDEGLLMVI